MRFLLKDRVIQEEGLSVFNMHNKIEKHFNINIAPVWSRAEEKNKAYFNST
jgi:hypothetical protein